MMNCKDCAQVFDRCICAMVDKFFAENGHLMERLARSEATDKELKIAQAAAEGKCLACWFDPCRCKEGLENK